MTQNFVMAFGGTGARCLEALTYAVAADAVRAPIHLLLVDPDETNGNVAQALSQLRRYYAVHRHVRPTEHNGVRPFFATAMNTGLGPESFFWANPSPNVEFATLMEYTTQADEAKALLNLLYDESDLQLTFERGYIGRAHIGSLDLLRVLQAQIRQSSSSDGPNRSDSMQEFFHAVREATQQPGGARLLVIGSVFGGTGASGLPAVPPLLRSVLPSGLQRDLTIGCIQLAPYFSFPPGRPEDPDSALHPLATQAALYHYSLTDTGYDRIYLLGAPGREQSNRENVVGGDAQRNTAHYAELAAALAAAHFFADPPEHNRSEVVACGAEEVSWDKLPYQHETELRRRMAAFGAFCAMHASFLAEELSEQRHIGSKWMMDLTSGRNRALGGQEMELRDLRDFAARFIGWAAELQRVADVDLFSVPVPVSEDALTLVRGASGRRPYHEIYRGLSSAKVGDQETGPGWYVEALTRAAFDFCDTAYTGWGRRNG
jgi:hypothetical protein